MSITFFKQSTVSDKLLDFAPVHAQWDMDSGPIKEPS